MDPIGQVNQLLEALRRQLAENIERLRQSGKLAAAGRAGGSARSPAAPESLEAALRRKLAAVDRRSAEGVAAAARIFVEAALVEEFGGALLNDPGFGEMIADLSASLRQEPELRERLDRILAEL